MNENSLNALNKNRYITKVRVTPKVIDDLVKSITLGAPLNSACQYAGIGTDLFQTWMNKGYSLFLRKQEGEDLTLEELMLVEFYEKIDKANGDMVVRNLAVINRAGETNWIASAWLLERTKPEHFALTQRNINQNTTVVLSSDELKEELQRFKNNKELENARKLLQVEEEKTNTVEADYKEIETSEVTDDYTSYMVTGKMTANQPQTPSQAKELPPPIQDTIPRQQLSDEEIATITANQLAKLPKPRSRKTLPDAAEQATKTTQDGGQKAASAKGLRAVEVGTNGRTGEKHKKSLEQARKERLRATANEKARLKHEKEKAKRRADYRKRCNEVRTVKWKKAHPKPPAENGL